MKNINITKYPNIPITKFQTSTINKISSDNRDPRKHQPKTQPQNHETKPKESPSEHKTINTRAENTCRLIHILPGRCSAHDIVNLLDLTPAPIIVFLVDDEFVGTGTTYEAVAVLGVFGVFGGGDLGALDCEVVAAGESVREGGRREEALSGGTGGRDRDRDKVTGEDEDRDQFGHQWTCC
jgi:hypothetical protein